MIQKHYIPFFFCLVILCTTGLYAQRLPKQMIFKPEAYVLPYEGLSLAEATETPSKGKLWFVYGDQDGMLTNSRPAGGSALQQLAFGQIYCVVDEDGEYLRLALDHQVNYRGKLSSEAEDFGWIHKSDVLLWEHCLISPQQGNLYRKVMILNTLRSLSEESFERLESGRVNFYLDSKLENPSGRSSGLFEVYFVYKTDPDHQSVLLGRASSFSKGGESTIVGWVSADRVINWDQRVALEPNWSNSAIEERRTTLQKVRFFNETESAQAYGQEGRTLTQNLIWDDDPLGGRRIGEYRRFPVLAGKLDDQVVKVGVMGDINAEHARITAGNMAEIQRTVAEGKSQARNVDILFVIDASKSMEPYFPAVSKAVEQSVEDILGAPGDKNNYRFGATIYRDHSEGKYAVEVSRLSQDAKQVTSFLNQVPGESAVKNANDLDLPEALYYGLQNGIRATGLNRDHTNVVVLIGDCGNHSRKDRTTVRQETIIQLLSDYYCNMLVFQANRGEQQAFQSFIDQSRELVSQVANRKYREMQTQATEADIALPFPNLVTDPLNDNFYRLEGGAVAGSILSPQRGQSLDPDQLSGEVRRLISDTRENTNRMMDAIEFMVNSGDDFETILATTPPTQSPYVSSFPASIILFLYRQGFDADQLRLITSKSYQMFMEGYAPIQVEGHRYPLFKPVLLLSLRELADLLREMEKLQVSTENRRESFHQTWLQLLNTHVGNLSNEEMEQWSIERASEMIFGLPSASALASISIKDLLDPAVVDDYMLNEYVRQIYEKNKSLNRIFNQTDYKYNFRSNDITFFWIEQNPVALR